MKPTRQLSLPGLVVKDPAVWVQDRRYRRANWILRNTVGSTGKEDPLSVRPHKGVGNRERLWHVVLVWPEGIRYQSRPSISGCHTYSLNFETYGEALYMCRFLKWEQKFLRAQPHLELRLRYPRLFKRPTFVYELQTPKTKQKARTRRTGIRAPRQGQGQTMQTGQKKALPETPA